MKKTNIIKWLKACGFGCGVQYGDIFEYDLCDEIIYIPKHTKEEESDALFVEFLSSFGYCENYHINTLSVLHELGHYMTADDELMEESEFLKAMLKIADLDSRSYLFGYWDTPIELEANLWLIEFIKTQKPMVDELERVILS